MSALRTTRAAIPHMLGRGGSIIVIGSVNAVLPEPTIIDYTATKTALANLTKGLSKEFGPNEIRVNTISPGPVSTDLRFGTGGMAAQVGAASGSSPEDVVKSVGAAAATGRFTTPQEVADLAVFLARNLRWRISAFRPDRRNRRSTTYESRHYILARTRTLAALVHALGRRHARLSRL
jgi:NAD(P)-dependent dehydrogenase (short-subunit alcohol dehydrogenase family)